MFNAKSSIYICIRSNFKLLYFLLRLIEAKCIRYLMKTHEVIIDIWFKNWYSIWRLMFKCVRTLYYYTFYWGWLDQNVWETWWRRIKLLLIFDLEIGWITMYKEFGEGAWNCYWYLIWRLIGSQCIRNLIKAHKVVINIWFKSWLNQNVWKIWWKRMKLLLIFDLKIDWIIMYKKLGENAWSCCWYLIWKLIRLKYIRNLIKTQKVVVNIWFEDWLNQSV